MAEAFDPYHLWLAIPPNEQPPHHYRLLGVTLFESNADVLASAADQRMLHVRSFQTGKHSAESQKLLNELAAARLCLLNVEKRQAYDDALRARLDAKKAAAAPRVTPAKVLPVAKAIVSQPAAPADAWNDAIEAEPRARNSSRRSARNRRQTNSPSLYIAFGIGAVALVAIVWFVMNRGERGATPVASRNSSKPGKTARVEPSRTSEPVLPSKDLPANSGGVEPEQIAGSDIGAIPKSAESSADEMVEAVDDAEDSAVDIADSEAMAASAEANSAEPAVDDRRTPPTAELIAPAVLEIQRVFRDEYSAAKKPAEKSALVEKLLEMASASEGAVDKFALLNEAWRLATVANNPTLALKAAGDEAALFAVDRFDLLAKTAEALEERELALSAQGELADAIVPLVEAAAAAQQFASGRRLATVGVSAARKSNRADIVKALAQRRKDFVAAEKLAASAADARIRLEQDPDDGAANQTLGTYLCLVVGDWKAGLPYLSRSEDSALRAVAEAESAANEAPEAAVKLGDAWWELSEHDDVGNIAARARARHWFQLVAPSLTGLVRTRVEKRLKEFGDHQPSEYTGVGVVADKLVIWNCHNNRYKDRGMLTCNVELRKAGKVVWEKQGLELTWKEDAEYATAITLPKIAFDAVRLRTVSFYKYGSSLCEIEVFQADTNLARGKPVTASGVQDANFPAAAVVDGTKDSSKEKSGYWLAPDLKKAWIEVQVAPAVAHLTRTSSANDAKTQPANGKTPAASADRMVVWNSHNGKWADRGTKTCHVELRRAGKTVWSQKDLQVAWSAGEDLPTEIPLPKKVQFDTVRVDIPTWVLYGASLCEVEVWRGKKNLAAGKAVKASGERGEYKAATVVDGIKDSLNAKGYWWAEDHKPAWIEIMVAP